MPKSHACGGATTGIGSFVPLSTEPDTLLPASSHQSFALDGIIHPGLKANYILTVQLEV